MKIVKFLASTGEGGLENVFIDLCNALSHSEEVEVIVFKEASFLKKFDKNIRIHLLTSSSGRFNLLLYKELYTLIKRIKPDIVHTHAAKASQIFYYLNTFLHIPHVGTKHNSRKGKIFNKLSYVTAVSKGVKESINNSNTKVIYNGVYPKQLAAKETKNTIFTMLAVGRLDTIKGFDILIKECFKLEFPFLLQIVGEGKEYKNLKHLINELNLQDKVQLVGFSSEVPRFMQSSDLVVVSSHTEGLSLVMVESLFYANVLISTKVSGPLETLDEKFLIDRFNIANKIQEVYNNQEMYKKDFGILKNNVQKKFLLTHIIEEYKRYYQDIIAVNVVGNT
ncbi:MAG TPA: glycosyltransferase [Epsilonproteobacteria bacterium]|nr:glycosyltransferase [Campylobacterota bacterium]